MTEEKKKRKPRVSVSSKKGAGQPGMRINYAVDKYVGGRIKFRRLMLGMTASQLAEILGFAHSNSIAEVEAANKRADAGLLYETALALGVDVGYFFEGYRTGVTIDNFIDYDRHLRKGEK